jgi:hypothetical protein
MLIIHKLNFRMSIRNSTKWFPMEWGRSILRPHQSQAMLITRNKTSMLTEVAILKTSIIKLFRWSGLHKQQVIATLASNYIISNWISSLCKLQKITNRCKINFCHNKLTSTISRWISPRKVLSSHFRKTIIEKRDLNYLLLTKIESAA